jgi:hypothetical protein
LREFALLWTAILAMRFSEAMVAVAVGWQVYALTASAWDLGLVGLLQFVPALLLTLPAGHAADRFHRGRILALTMAASAALGVVLVVAVLSPIVQNWRRTPVDRFPLSYYPMFSEARGDTGRFNYVVGYDARGQRERIHYSVMGSGGLNQIRRQLQDAIEDGRTARLCQSIAAEIARRPGRRYSDVVRVDVVTGTYRYADYFTGNKTPLDEQVRATCPVERR